MREERGDREWYRNTRHSILSHLPRDSNFQGKSVADDQF